MLQIEMLPVDRLVPYIRNARTHDADQIAQIAASIAEFGFTNPILIGEDEVIIAGHGRLMAAKALGLTEVPVIVLDHLTGAQRRALVIADNRIAENAGWDDDLLRSELATLQEADFDLGLIGFDETSSTRSWQASRGLAWAAVTVPRSVRVGAAGKTITTATTAPPPTRRWPNASASRPSRSSRPARAGGRIASAPGWIWVSAPNSAAGGTRRRAPSPRSRMDRREVIPRRPRHGDRRPAPIHKDIDHYRHKEGPRAREEAPMAKALARTFGQDLMRGEHVVGAGQAAAQQTAPQNGGVLMPSHTSGDPSFYAKKRAKEAELGRDLTTEEFLSDHYAASDAPHSLGHVHLRPRPLRDRLSLVLPAGRHGPRPVRGRFRPRHRRGPARATLCRDRTPPRTGGGKPGAGRSRR